MTATPKTAFSRFMLRGLITGRTILAVSTLSAPRQTLRLLRVPGDGTPAPMLLRMFGVRNGVLALGLSHLDELRAPRRFVGINVIVDFIDALAFIAAGRREEVSRTGATLTTAIALSAVAAGAAAFANLPPDQHNS